MFYKRYVNMIVKIKKKKKKEKKFKMLMIIEGK